MKTFIQKMHIGNCDSGGPALIQKNGFKFPLGAVPWERTKNLEEETDFFQFKN
jgi:hypothetical protein